MTMKLRSFFYALTAGVVMLLLLAGGGWFWVNAHSPLTLLQEREVKNPTAAIFVPKQAPAMISLLVNPDRLAALQQVVVEPQKRGRAIAQFQQLENSLLFNLGLDYQRDIQPWIDDELTLAVTSLDVDRNPENAAQPGYLLIFTTNEPQAAQEQVYSRRMSADSADLVVESYQGVNLTYQPSNPGGKKVADDTESRPIPDTLTSAIVGDRFVLYANHPKVLRNAINTVQVADLSLAEDPDYQQLLQSLTEPRIGFSVVNLPALAAWISNQPIPNRESFEASKSLALTLSLTPQGLLAQTAIPRSKSSLEPITPVLSQPVGALQYIPAQSALAIAGVDLNQFWRQLSTRLEADENLNSLLNQGIAWFKSRWGIQLPKEIFSWVEGDYALSWFPRSDGPNPDWIFVAQRGKNDQAIDGIEHLDIVAQQQGLNVGELPFADRTITAWTKLVTAKALKNRQDGLLSLQAQVQGVHTTVGDYEVFATSIEAMDAALNGVKDSLLHNPRFQNAIAALPTQNDGYLYINWLESQPLLERQIPIVRVVELIGQPLFDHLRSLTITSYGVNQGVQQSKLFFQWVDQSSS
ncbi:DUF3352 domain-containing protein [Coleofasciculus sp. G2-EDA-02]|uniref:DUF3352 domain-containing protein n=1 Tax=Coleofasciculus sp. G2-EDA-02 TaxID=3069529 RepID=UPI0032F50F8F